MEMREVIKLLEARNLTKEEKSISNTKIKGVFACDLMSDVLALSHNDDMLITGLATIQSVRTADIKDIKCVVFVRGKVPPQNVIDMAEELEIALFTTDMIMFEVCGVLYQNGMRNMEG